MSSAARITLSSLYGYSSKEDRHDEPEPIVINGVPIVWSPRTSYCGELPPRHLTNASDVVNWLSQKTRKEPVNPELTRWENLRRVLEQSAMIQLQTRLLRSRSMRVYKH